MTTRFLYSALCVFALTFACPSFAQQPSTSTVWIMQDSQDSDQAIRDLFTHPDQWSNTRPSIDVYQFSSLKDVSDTQLKNWSGQLKAWNIKIAIQTGVFNAWAPSASKMIEAQMPSFMQLKNDGASVYAVTLDEPLNAAREEIKNGDDFAAQETASYISQLRKLFPGVLVGDTEPYPAIAAADQIAWIARLNARLAAIGQPGLDYYRIDPNAMAIGVFASGSWKDLWQLESYCRGHKIVYSMIYWASSSAGMTKHGMSAGRAWYVGAICQAGELAVAGCRPDQYVIESKMSGARTLPETDPFSFMGVVNEIATHFAKAAH